MSKLTYQKWWIFFHLVIKKFFIKSTNGHRSCLVESTVDLGHTQTWAVVWAAWHWGSHIEFQSPSGILGVHLLTLNWSQYKGHRKSLVQLLTYNRPSAIVVQSLSHVQLFVTPWTAAHQASLSFTNSWSLLIAPRPSRPPHLRKQPLASSCSGLSPGSSLMWPTLSLVPAGWHDPFSIS